MSNIFSNDSFSTIQTEKSLLSVSQFIILMIKAYLVMKHEMKQNQSSQNSLSQQNLITYLLSVFDIKHSFSKLHASWLFESQCQFLRL